MAAPKSSFRHSKNAGLVDSASHILHEGKLNTTYPTRSLQFLQHATSADEPVPPPPATCPLDVLVVGAGIGGLAAATTLRLRGHAVAVVEQAPELAEVGAGVQVPPNATRLLRRWGVAPLLAPRCVRPEASVFRRWADSSAVGRVGLMPAVGEWFGAPYWVVHRADYQRALYERAVGLGVEVVFGQRVVGIDEARGAVRVEGGGEWVADLVVAADGIHSEGRKAVLKDRDQPPVLTGLAAYRATIPAEKIKEDPDTAWMLDRYIQNGWLGDARHVVTYTIAGGEAVNVVLIHPEPSDPSTWKQETAISDMKREFEGWDYRVTKLISLIDKTLKWPLMAGQALDHWVSESSRVVIMGDAAHAMLPFMSQGAAQAVEDGGSLATLVSSISSRSELPTALRIFEQLRIPRTAQMQQASFVNGRIFHFRDGPEQRARDAAMRDEVEHKHYLQSPNGLSDPTTQIWCYGYDAEEEARKAWEREMETSARAVGGLQGCWAGC